MFRTSKVNIQRQGRRSNVSIVNFEYISYLFIMFLFSFFDQVNVS